MTDFWRAGRNVALRTLTVKDAAITQKWRTSGRAWLLNRGAQNVEEQAAWIESRPRTEYNFIQVLHDGTPVGMISLVDVDEVHRHAEAAHFLIGEPDAVRPFGNGVIAAEATLLLHRFAFEVLGLHRIYGPVASDNVQMIRWNRYIGMVEEGRLRDHYWLNGHWQDAVMMGLCEDRWRSVTVPRLQELIGETK